MINFSKAVKQFDLIVENGPLGTRLKYDYGYDVSFELPSKKAGRRALTKLYEGDIAVAKTHHLPIIVNALTFRARSLYDRFYFK